MEFELHCMSILHTKLSFFNYDKVKSVLQSITPLTFQYNKSLWPLENVFWGGGGVVHYRPLCLYYETMAEQIRLWHLPPFG